MKIIITEEQSKKLFIPRNLENRDAQLDNEIKKFFSSKKNYIIWDYTNSIMHEYNFESDYGNTIITGLNDRWVELEKIVDEIEKTSAKNDKDFKIKQLYSEYEMIEDFLISLTNMVDNRNYDILSSLSVIEKNGNGSFTYRLETVTKIDNILKNITI